MTDYRPMVLIPHYNHSATLTEVVAQLRTFDLPILIVDDGSATCHLTVLQQLETLSSVEVIYRQTNGGKGAAMKTGFQAALTRGFTHAIQVDADGQHHLADISTMLEKSRQNPTALICGKPVYGKDAPKARLYGRKITNFWLAVNTCSLRIQDGMCGFRFYPLAAVCDIIKEKHLGDRMDFDIEILVYADWQGVPMIWVDTPVKYEEGGVSHFRGWADNWLISKMHARLFFIRLGQLFNRGKK